MESSLKECSAMLLAKLYGLTERRVQQLAKEGIFVRMQHGQYDLQASVARYTAHVQKLAEVKEEPLKRERQRLVKVQADRIEQENKRQGRQLMDMALVKDLLQDVAVQYAACIDALPGKCAHELTNLPDPALVKARLFQECRVLRQITAQRLQRFGDFLDRAQAVRGKSRRALSADPGSVGG